MLEPGRVAPTFTARNQNHELFDLAAERGSWVLLWWYPKASTPG